MKPVKNDFQNIGRGRDRFTEFTFDPYGILDTKELDALTLNIQKCHIIRQNLEIADADFAKHAAGARLGETILLVGTDIRCCEGPNALACDLGIADAHIHPLTAANTG